MTKFFDYLRKHNFRLIDSHTGIAGAHLFVKILAVYGSTTLYLIHIGTMKWIKVYWQYHYYFRGSNYPLYTFELSVFGVKLIDTGKEAKLLTRESNEKWMSERAAKKKAAKERIEGVDPEAASFIF